MAHVRTLAREDTTERVGCGRWLDLIHEVNRLAPGTFGAPEHMGPWWAGGYVEEYPDARVLHRDDSPQTVSVVGKTAKGHNLIREAAHNLGLSVTA